MMKSLKIVGILLVLCRVSHAVTGNVIPASLPDAEARLGNLFSAISPDKSDSDKLQLADTILFTLDSILQLPGAFDYPFDSLRAMGKITSANRKIRILTWNLPFNDGTNRYFGYVMHKTDNSDAVRLFKLKDRRSSITDPLLATLGAENWYGCLVYAIIEKKSSGETCYTLLGYDPTNIFSARKLVDVLWFDDNNNPVFGKAIFHSKNLYRNRVLFEYSARVQMSLKWHEGMNMIIFDHLSPSKPSYTGNYQYYVPDLTYDALRFEKGVWEMVENVDVRN